MSIIIEFQDGTHKKYTTFEEITCLSNYNDTVKLYCSCNKLTELPKLPDSLKELHCNNNKLTKLPELPVSLKWLYCVANQLTKIPELTFSLQVLTCSDNKLRELPPLPKNLKKLICDNNLLFKLPFILPPYLKVLICSYNKLTEIPEIPETLKIQKIIKLADTLNDNDDIFLFSNPIFHFIEEYFDRNLTNYLKWKLNWEKKFVRKIENWFYELRWNPKYDLCQRVVNQTYDDLNNSV